MSFARTKIQCPRLRPQQQIQRPALQAALRVALGQHRLVLLSAPAGFGKTTALAEALAADNAPPLAWVSLDEDDDLARLLECLIAALEPQDPPWRLAPEALVAMAEAGAPPAQIATELVNTLEACDLERGVIVLDDLHRLHDGPALALLAHLIERLGQRWTLVLASRHDPAALPLARLRVQGELAEFRQAELGFSAAEAQALGERHGVDAEAVLSLHARTEGWPAGLRLALNASRNGVMPAGAVDRHVFDFLASEVLDRLRPELRDFLLDTSVLPELDAARCAAVTGQAHAALLLDEVERLGLFATSVDGAQRTLRLHDLFRAALQQQLERQRPLDLLPLRQRAAAAEPDAQRRVALLLQAGDEAAAKSLLAARAARWLTEGAVQTVHKLLDGFAPALRQSSSALQCIKALLAWSRWDFPAMAEAARRALALAESRQDEAQRQQAQGLLALALNALGQVDASGAVLGPLRRERMSDATRVLVLVASSWHALDMGSMARIGPVLDETVDTLERLRAPEYWYMATPILRFIGLPGTRGALQRHAEGVRRLAEADRPTALSAASLLIEAWLATWDGRLEAADALMDRADADCRWVGDPPNVRRTVRQQQALMLALRGRRATVESLVQPALQQPGALGSAWSAWHGLRLAARAAAICDHGPLLRACLDRLEPALLPEQARAAGERLAALSPLPAQLHWLEGRPAAAIAGWRALLPQEAQIDQLGQAAELRVRLAHALLVAEDDAAGAAAVLAPALQRALAEGGPGGLLFGGSALQQLASPALQARLQPHLPEALAEPLRRWAARVGWRLEPILPAAAGDEVDGVTDASDASEAGAAVVRSLVRPQPALSAAPQALPGEVLSPREREVLERIAAGDSNKLIARAFDLSPHTVKRHVANVLAKLGLTSRGQAAAWWFAQDEAARG
ncbi:MAG: AAA family ATPase [Burkholderiaceae bacterium]|nr:AAA family ATPase [Burkholderiaceae bacterium]